MFKKLLVANRGEIAVRVLRTAREMGIGTVAVYSQADRKSLHVEIADEAVEIGPPAPLESYLNIPRIIKAAKTTGAEAIHPGYGFLAENAPFAKACKEAGLIFVGPPADALRRVGDKLEARKLALSVGAPVIPGMIATQPDIAAFKKEAQKIGYPVLIKAAAGGGGKGMRVVSSPSELDEGLQGAMREAQSAFGDATVYLEKYIAEPRHIEMQILCDEHGNAVWLGERECSIQRRHQKIIEESPSPVMTSQLRQEMGQTAVKIVKAAGYRNAGTVEFLYEKGSYYFLEVNARLQVEHPVTEFCTGLDLVALQLHIASGEEIPFSQQEVYPRGHAIECRIYAEDPTRNFLPSSGVIAVLEEPQGPGVRCDSALREGLEISVHYDPILSKVITYGENRAEAIRRMRRALSEYMILGVATPISLLLNILEHPAFVSGELSTHFLEHHFPNWKPPKASDAVREAALMAVMVAHAETQHGSGAPLSKTQPTPWQTIGPWEIARGAK
jgi:acetyl-CoA carboxylase biotin carboxylase subunit